MFKQNKSLDLNGLLEQQAQGKLKNKNIKFPILAQIKYDGNCTVTEVRGGNVKHYTSGNLTYIHIDDYGFDFADVADGYYLAERIGGEGKLGDRTKCNLRGSKHSQTSENHSYMVFDYISIKDYEAGKSSIPYAKRMRNLEITGVPADYIVGSYTVHNMYELEILLYNVVKQGYEGLMLIAEDFIWEDTKSRKPHLCKYKRRRTADLACIGTVQGEGKYVGMIGALVLQDSEGRIVCVGSGLTDAERAMRHEQFVHKIIEIEYEQILDTYIQPTFICVRYDKRESD